MVNNELIRDITRLGAFTVGLTVLSAASLSVIYLLGALVQAVRAQVLPPEKLVIDKLKLSLNEQPLSTKGKETVMRMELQPDPENEALSPAELYPGMSISLQGLPVFVMSVQRDGEETKMLKLKPMGGVKVQLQGGKSRLKWGNELWLMKSYQGHLVLTKR